MSRGTDSDAETEGTSPATSPPRAQATENGGGENAPSPAAAGGGVMPEGLARRGRLEAEEEKLHYETSLTPKPDVYGQYHPLETPELISGGLVRLKEELGSIPEEKKAGWERACERCPDLVGDSHKLMFLRCEAFHADRAALRMVKYWDRRIELFGEERAFLPLTLEGALKDDIDALIFGLVRMNDRMVDATGRRILFMDPALLDHAYDRESMNRAMWYTIHAALEDDVTQRRGIVMIVYPLNAKLKQFDGKLIRVDIDSIRGCIPVRVGAFHVCHPPLFAHIVMPVIKLIIGPRLSSRFHVIMGKKEVVLEKLDKFGIPKKSVPSDLGGYLVLDQDLWLADRRVAGG